jgi:hypothetical protein
MIFNQRYLMRGMSRPAKDNPPLLIDPDTMKPSQVSLQGLKAITREHSQILQTMRCVEHIQFSYGSPKNIGRKAANTMGLSTMKMQNAKCPTSPPTSDFHA